MLLLRGRLLSAPGSLTSAEIDSALDQKWLEEQARRSLYRLFPAFHDYPITPEEVEPIDAELSVFALID